MPRLSRLGLWPDMGRKVPPARSQGELTICQAMRHRALPDLYGGHKTSQHGIVQGLLRELHGAFGTDLFGRRTDSQAICHTSIET